MVDILGKYFRKNIYIRLIKMSIFFKNKGIQQTEPKLLILD